MHHGDVSPEIAQGLLALKKRIDAAKIPSSKLDQTIHVADSATATRRVARPLVARVAQRQESM